MKKFLLIFLFLFLTQISQTFAQEKFSTSLHTIYNIYEYDPTEVIYNFKVKNNTSDFIVSKYNLFINYSDANNISVTDAKGKVDFISKKSKDGTTLNLNFTNKVAGINREKEFQVRFNTINIYKVAGNNQEVLIEKIPDQSNYQNLTAEVNLPDNFSEQKTVNPNVTQKDPNKLVFKNLASGINIYSGTNKIYDLDLNYHLYNKNLVDLNTEISFPHDTAYQSVYILDISPKPINIRMDEDGNYLAKYLLKPSQKVDINIKAKVKVTSIAQNTSIYNLESNSLIRGRKYWDVENNKIKKVAKNKNQLQIYEYILNNLEYRSSQNARRGAKEVIIDGKNSNAIDYADTFVSLSRANGIPSRVLQGFIVNPTTLNSNSDLLHAWAEYFDFKQKTWYMIDPALADATGLKFAPINDLNHITFTTLGNDSQKPHPAGTYKLKDTKDIKVTVSNQFGLPKSQVKIRSEIGKQYGGLNIEGKIYFKNLTGAKIPTQKFKINSLKLSPQDQELNIPVIPPYGEVYVNISFAPVGFLTKETDTFKITLGENNLEQSVQILPIYQNKKIIFSLLGIILSVTAIAVFLITRRARNL